MMPGMDGYQVASKIKGDLATKNIPVIMVTALEDRHARMLGLSAGAEDFITKPVDRAELRVRVRNLLRLKAYGDYHDRYSRMLEDEVGSRAVELRKLWLALKQSPVGVVLTDGQGTIEYVNPRFVEMSGYSELEALGQNNRLVRSGFHPEEFYRELWTTILSGLVFRGEMCNRHKSGEIYWEQAVIAPVRNGEGQISNFIAFQEDITARKLMERQLAQSEEKFKGIFDAMQDGYFTGSPTGSLTLVNPAAVHLLGYENAAELLAVPLGGLFADAQERDKVLGPLLELGQMAYQRCMFRRKDGSLRVFEGSSRIQPGPEGQFVESVFRDITERVEAEEIQQARRAADEANRLKSQFLAHMSHEIRTPLHAILGMTHLTLGTQLNGRQRHYLEHIQRGGGALLAIVNDILDFSKVEAGRLELERVEFQLDDVLENLVSVLAAKAHEKGLEFILRVAPEVPAQLLGDPLRLGQVLINLVGNAIKFTERGQVLLSIGLDSGSGGAVFLGFEIRDTGVGLSAPQIDGLFVCFAQADSSTTRKFGGTGLGLAICQRLIHLMQGEIHVQSLPGKGSTFAFTARFEAVEAPERVTLPDLSDLRALVIQDGPTSLALRRLSVRVSERSTAEGALKEPPYDLAFVSRVDCLESACHLVGADQPGERVVLLAPHGDEAAAERASAAGFNSILFTPFTQSRLLDTVLSLLGRPQFQRARLESVPAISSEVIEKIRGARVLLVEDNAINQEIAQELLESAGLRVDVASDGRQAVERILGCGSSCPWQAVLMDLQMPEMDGYTATAAIRQDDRFRRLPILAMTAHVLPEERQRCCAAGMDDYISKPIDPSALFATLGRWISLPDTLPPRIEEFPTIAGVDTINGLARVAGNRRLYRSLLLDLAGEEQQTSAALQSADSEQLSCLGHTLRGTAANLGVLEVASLAAELERRARAGRPEDAAECLARLLATMAEVDGLIVAALEGPPWRAGSDTPCHPDTARAAVARLEALLESWDGAALDAFQELQQLVGSALPGETHRLGRLVDRFQFREALVELRSLNAALGGPTCHPKPF